MAQHFISYSSVDALDFALRLHDTLEAGPPSISVWLDKRELKPGQDWDEQIVEAIRICESLLFVMTRDSVESQSVCKQEWTRALKYKKPIIPILFHQDAEMPFRLGSRQCIDFTGVFDPALAELRNHLQWLASPEGILQAMKDRLADAQRDLCRTEDSKQQARIQDEIALLEKQIADQQRIIADPQRVARHVEESIARGLEQERQPEEPGSGVTRSKFINPPPGVAPTYFQDRHVETNLIREGVGLGGLGNCYTDLGQLSQAMDSYEQALAIAREIGDRRVEAAILVYKGNTLADQSEWENAVQLYNQAIQIADEIGSAQFQNEARIGLAFAHLYSGDLPAAHAAAEAARRFDFPPNIHNVLALLGVIALRRGDRTAAQEAFAEARIQADALLSHCEQNYNALDAKGLALCGLALCADNSSYIPEAIDIYRAARAIIKDAGIAGRVLRLFDALALADSAGVLAEVWRAATGE